MDQLVGHGVTFANAFVSTPLCCPSRATILTGQYAHGTGVYSNGGANGGFKAFDDSSTLATWLHSGGYKTGLVGKYLNGYSGTYIPPGWDRWIAFDSQPDYFNYELNVDGNLQRRGGNPEDYATDVLATYASDFIRSAGDGPLFLYFAPFVPHAAPGTPLGATPAPRDVGALDGLHRWRPPNYNESDVTDKPPWIRAGPRFTANASARGDTFRQEQLEALLSADEAVARIIAALRDTGRLANTLVVFMSDNGIAWGEHRRLGGKTVPYEENIRVPLVIRYDRLRLTKRSDERLAVNVDIAPTLTAAAGVSAPGAEGLNLLPVLAGDDPSWREDFVLERSRPRGKIPSYCGVRSQRYKYVQYITGFEELYDLTVDPFELNNRANDPLLRGRLLDLRQRVRELCSPPPPRFHFKAVS